MNELKVGMATNNWITITVHNMWWKWKLKTLMIVKVHDKIIEISRLISSLRGILLPVLNCSSNL